ncbi:MAG: hypothetical protein HAW64_03010 [Alphaproteobacteria bacterium]|nr:hypothetical protein [Alphaproteobacteria bacterium]
MPYIPIPKDKIKHLPLFGYEILNSNQDGVAVWHHVRGYMFIEYARPIVWADDVGEAIQMGTTAITNR